MNINTRIFVMAEKVFYSGIGFQTYLAATMLPCITDSDKHQLKSNTVDHHF